MMIDPRAAIAAHSTETYDDAWDGPAAVARLPSERGPLRAAHAWVDPDGDPDAKSSYKFPHHTVSEDGEVGGANVRAAIAGIAVLNGGRGGAAIPDADRPGVYRHLARHLRDADREPPELAARSDTLGGYDVRAWPMEDLEVREDATGLHFGGYAAVFDVDSEPLPFVERIEPGAFAKSLRDRKRDVRMFLNHNPDILLASKSGGTLRLKEDEHGLLVDADLPDTSHGRDLATLMRRGDVSKMSFGFTPVRDSWSEDGLRRQLREVMLFDVSPITGFPAYPATSAYVRSLAGIIDAAPDELGAAFRVLLTEDGRLSDDQVGLLRSAINARRDGIAIVPAKLADWRASFAPLMSHAGAVRRSP
jgi:HK97 family phage prohead protease